MRIPLLDALASKKQTFTTAEAYKAWGAGPAMKTRKNAYNQGA